MAIFNSFLLTFTTGYSLLIFRLRRCSVFVPLPAPRWFPLHPHRSQKLVCRRRKKTAVAVSENGGFTLRNEDKEVLTNHWIPKRASLFQTHVAFSCMLQTSNYFGRCGCHEGHSHSLRLDQEVPETGLQKEIHQAAEP